MNDATRNRDGSKGIRFVYDPSFDEADAANRYDASEAADPASFGDNHMPDEITRDTSKRMHYAAFRLSKAHGPIAKNRWRQIYFDLRDRIVLGNRKLVYRAVRRRMAMSNKADDLIGDCHIVLIQVVAAFNPWMGIRFSTYAFTCLLRALSRMAQRASNDWLARSLSLDGLSDGEPCARFDRELASTLNFGIDEYLGEEHPLLSNREKMILRRRFHPSAGMPLPTLEIVGRELGLSKERVRQLQACAISKLRGELLGKL